MIEIFNETLMEVLNEKIQVFNDKLMEAFIKKNCGHL
jgi:hypothetical protein